MITGFLVSLGLCTSILRCFPVLDRKTLISQIAFSKSLFFSFLLSSFFLSLDKVAIGTYLGYRDLGLYGAYVTATYGILSQLFTIIGAIYIQSVLSHLSSIQSTIKKIDKKSLIFFLPLTFIISIISSFILLLFGRQYSYSLLYIVLFSIYATLSVYFNLYATIAIIYSKKTLHLSIIFSSILNAVFVILFLGFMRLTDLSIVFMVVFMTVYLFCLTLLARAIVVRSSSTLLYE